MKKNLLNLLLLCLLSTGAYAQFTKTKKIDEGGSGPYKALAVSEQSLPDFVVYRPENLQAAAEKEGPLPILVWANGGCMNSSINHERLLSDLASQGYLIVAIGALQMVQNEWKHEHTPDDKLLEAIAWISAQAEDKDSDYYQKVDLGKIAAGGQSCGGAQTMRIAGDPRVKSYLMVNSGMGDMSMAGASTQSLQKLNGKVLYIVGGPSDVATNNALLDYDRISGVPVAFADMLESGHGGTFNQEYGGPYTRMVQNWLDWQFKDKSQSQLFVDGDLAAFPGWTMKSKNF